MVPATLSQWSRHGPWFAIFLRDASNQGPFLFPTRQGGKQLPGSLYILMESPFELQMYCIEVYGASPIS